VERRLAPFLAQCGKARSQAPTRKHRSEKDQSCGFIGKTRDLIPIALLAGKVHFLVKKTPAMLRLSPKKAGGSPGPHSH